MDGVPCSNGDASIRLRVGISMVDGWFGGDWSLDGSFLGLACRGSGFADVGLLIVNMGFAYCSLGFAQDGGDHGLLFFFFWVWMVDLCGC